MSRNYDADEMSSSSASSLSSRGSEHAAVPLHEDNIGANSDADLTTPVPRRESLARRISNATFNYFTDPERPRSNYYIDPERPRSSSQVSTVNSRARKLSAKGNEFLNLHYSDLNPDYLFGQDQIEESFARPADGEEESASLDSGSANSSESLEEFPRLYSARSQRKQSYATEDEVHRSQSSLPRRNTVTSAIQNITSKFGFWDKEFHAHRIAIVLAFLKNYVILILGFCIALCIYWGSYYDRNSRFHKLKFAVINADRQVGQLPGILGETVEYFFTNVTQIQQLGTFHIIDYDTISGAAARNGHSITEEVYHQIHHEKYWAAYYIKENATLTMYQALKSASADLLPSDSLMEAVYETGRDYNAVSNYISTFVIRAKTAFYTFLPQSGYMSNLLKLLNSTEIENVLTNSPNLITTLPSFVINDRLPVTNPVVQAPFQIGLIYLVIFSFFQFVFSIQIHMYIAQKIKGLQYVMYRLIASHIAYVVLALAYVTLNAAFGIKFTTTFGRSGFLVVWSFAYLTIASLGSLIEALALILFMIKPQLIGFLLLFIAVINVAPTVSLIELCPSFYRYGYAIPVHNAYELLHVPYFNKYKGHMGLNIGVLVAWIVVSTIVMVVIMKYMGDKKKAADRKEAQEKEDLANEQNQS